MVELFSYFLPRQHTSLRRSLLICSIAAIVSLPIDIAAYQLLGMGDGVPMQWLQLLLALAAWAIRAVPMFSSGLAFCMRLGLIDTGELALQATLVRGFWPRHARKDPN